MISYWFAFFFSDIIVVCTVSIYKCLLSRSVSRYIAHMLKNLLFREKNNVIEQSKTMSFFCIYFFQRTKNILFTIQALGLFIIYS